MSERRPSIERVREAIRTCPNVGSDPWIVGLSIETLDGERIEGDAIYLADPDTAVLETKDGKRRIAVAEIIGVLSELRSPGPE
jgi:hypothetical protein